MTSKITFSFMSDMVDYYAEKLCGNIVREKWVNDRLIELDSDAAELGCYFEYYFTLLVTGKGSLPKNGLVPQRKMYKDGSKPLAPYALAEVNAKRLKGYFEKMGIKVLSAGRKVTKGKFQGTLDLVVEMEGKTMIFDLKYSGLLDNKWEKFGWGAMLFEGDNTQKSYHGMQAKQYSFLMDLPFAFVVVSSTNEYDMEMFLVANALENQQEHIDMGNHLFEKFKFDASIGFDARPDLSTCNKCPLRGECTDKYEYPRFKEVVL